MTMNKITQGRRKIEMKKIENMSSRRVTFSKRRGGIFKKSSEICVLSGWEIAIIVESISGNRLFSFGSPNVESVLKRYRGDFVVGDEARESDRRYTASDEIEMELERKKNKARMSEEGSGCYWWDESVDSMGLTELEEYGAALEAFAKKVIARADDLTSSQGFDFNAKSEGEVVGIFTDDLIGEEFDYGAALEAFAKTVSASADDLTPSQCFDYNTKSEGAAVGIGTDGLHGEEFENGTAPEASAIEVSAPADYLTSSPCFDFNTMSEIEVVGISTELSGEGFEFGWCDPMISPCEDGDLMSELDWSDLID